MALPRFTPREEQVLEQLIKGVVPTKEIARALGIAHGTVKVHIANMEHKTGTNNKAALIARLLREEREKPADKVLPTEYHFQWRKG